MENKEVPEACMGRKGPTRTVSNKSARLTNTQTGTVAGIEMYLLSWTEVSE